jgi:hypothetical protein
LKNALREEARLAGHKAYMPDRPCKNGHLELRGVANGTCRQCARENSQANRLRHPEQSKAASRNWYAKNKEHAAAWKREWIANNTEKYIARRKRYRSVPTIRARELLTSTKWIARERGMPHDLDRAWIAEKLAAGKCELTGIAFNFEPLENSRSNPYTASLDRIIPEKGYVKSNVRCILWALNAAFNSYGENVYADIARVYLARHPDRGTGLT